MSRKENGCGIKWNVNYEEGNKGNEMDSTDTTDGANDGEEGNMEVEDDAKINRLADIIAGGRDKRPRLECDELVKISERVPLGITPYTGAAIRFMSIIRYWDRSI